MEMIGLNEYLKAYPWMKSVDRKQFTFHADIKVCKEMLIETFQNMDRTMDEFEWLPEYDHIAEWMTDTKGKGLFLTGDVGRGKTVIIKHVLPTLFFKYQGKVIRPYHSDHFHSELNQIQWRNLLSLDDVGAESEANDYGKKYLPFIEIMHKAAQVGKFLLISSNLNHSELNDRYGLRIIDRIESLCKVVAFEGDSMRK